MLVSTETYQTDLSKLYIMQISTNDTSTYLLPFQKSPPVILAMVWQDLQCCAEGCLSVRVDRQHELHPLTLQPCLAGVVREQPVLMVLRPPPCFLKERDDLSVKQWRVKVRKKSVQIGQNVMQITMFARHDHLANVTDASGNLKQIA